MAKEQRLALIGAIEARRHTKVLTYVTSTRGGLEVQMAMDSIRIFFEHLSSLTSGGEEKIDLDLFLHSNGGDGIVPWRLVTLVREYANRFAVLVPNRAFSAATLAALGADEIVMHPMGMLGPTDPTVTNAFNPPNPRKPAEQLGISVEDLTAYVALVKEDFNVTEGQHMVQALSPLAVQVHPLALGNVKRSISQSRLMARKLLGLHMRKEEDKDKIETIVENLTSRLFYHGHPINRSEARELGLSTVKDPDREVERAMWDLYADYEREMQMDVNFEMAQEFLADTPGIQPGQQEKTAKKTAKLTYIESSAHTDVNVLDYELVGQMAANFSTTVTMIVSRRAWMRQ